MSQAQIRRRQRFIEKPKPSRKWNPFRPFDWDQTDAKAKRVMQVDVEMQEAVGGSHPRNPTEDGTLSTKKDMIQLINKLTTCDHSSCSGGYSP